MAQYDAMTPGRLLQYLLPMRIIWWVKRDIRLSDNEPLTRAVEEAARIGGEVLPVYVFEPSLIAAPETGALHLTVVLDALTSMRQRLRAAGADLLLLTGEIPAIFEALLGEFPFDRIVAEEETGTHITFDRDRRLRAWARAADVSFDEYPHNGVVRGLTDRDQRMKIWKERMSRAPAPAPSTIPMASPTRKRCAATEIPTTAELGLSPAAGAVQRVDEEAALIVLESFLQRRGREYSRGISSPALSRFTGSRLSVHLAWGTISLRTVLAALEARVAELRQARRGQGSGAENKGWLKPLGSFRSRLFWHDHFCQRLESEPEMEFHPLNRAYDDLPYENQRDVEKRFWEGRTGFPMVDASIRSLTETGFLNFRMRAMLVSFATFALHMDWRRIRDPMARIMADYLPGIHLPQLQMQAGVVGINTVRVYNPTKQLLDNDPDCRFVRRFLPELRGLPREAIIALAVNGVESPSHGRTGRHSRLADANGELPFGEAPFEYPSPIVDFRSRVRTMQSEVYSRKASAYGREEAARVLEKHGSRRRP